MCASFKAKRANYCKNTQQICKGKYDYSFKFSESCEKNKCTGQYGNQCTKDYCSFQDQTCSLFYWHLLKQVSTQTQKFIDTIKECPDTFKFKSTDVCLNENNCKLIDYTARKVIEMKCLCPKSHSYECGTQSCTVDKRTCEALNNLKFPTEFNKCLNGNKIFKSWSLLSYMLNKMFLQ